MDRLGRRDFAQILDFLAGAYAAPDLERFAAYVPQGLLDALSCDVVAYNEVHTKQHRVRWTYAGVDALFPEADKVFEAHLGEHPFFHHFRRTSASGAVKISDLISARQWDRNGMYAEFHRRLGVRHELAIQIPQPPLFFAVAAVRGGPDFTERDRAVLGMVQPHLVTAYHNASLASALERHVALMQRGLDASGVGVILLRPDDGIRSISEQARRWLGRYFDIGPDRTGRMPDALGAWLQRNAFPAAAASTPPLPPSPYVIGRGDTRLVATLLRQDGQRLILLQEKHARLRPEALAPAGLTTREAEVLGWVALGKTDAEVADILAISSRTVSHTLQRVYRKLGVGTRAGAVAAALRASDASA